MTTKAQTNDDILICNAGSSSLKLARWSPSTDELELSNHEGNPETIEAALRDYFEKNGACGTVLHRIVHAGDVEEGPQEISPALAARIRHWQVVAPLHNALALRLIHLTKTHWPEAASYAFFDSALFANLPAVSRSYALPEALSERWPIKRYGFHGLAHRAQWTTLNRHKHHRRVITLQLGSGCSATAWLEGKAVDTTMGFSPLEGLSMATRCGDIDAAIVLHLLEQEQGHTTAELRRLLTEESGLKGLSGLSGDMRELLSSSDEQARLAIDHFCYQIQKVIGSYIAVLGGVDAITFGGGIGENHPQIRYNILSPLRNLPIHLDGPRNSRAAGFSALHTDHSETEVWLCPANEEREMLDQFLRFSQNREGK